MLERTRSTPWIRRTGCNEHDPALQSAIPGKSLQQTRVRRVEVSFQICAGAVPKSFKEHARAYRHANRSPGRDSDILLRSQYQLSSSRNVTNPKRMRSSPSVAEDLPMQKPPHTISRSKHHRRRPPPTFPQPKHLHLVHPRLRPTLNRPRSSPQSPHLLHHDIPSPNLHQHLPSASAHRAPRRTNPLIPPIAPHSQHAHLSRRCQRVLLPRLPRHMELSNTHPAPHTRITHHRLRHLARVPLPPLGTRMRQPRQRNLQPPRRATHHRAFCIHHTSSHNAGLAARIRCFLTPVHGDRGADEEYFGFVG